MTDIGRDRGELVDDDRLPWLEPVEEEADEGEVSLGRLLAAVIAGLVAIGLVVGGVFWWRDRDSRQAAGSGEVIEAPAGDYKIKPEAPGGMAVAGSGEVAYGASQGQDSTARIDLSALPEEPVKPGAPRGIAVPAGQVATVKLPPSAAAPKPAQVAAATPRPVAPKPATPRPAAAPAPAAAAGGAQVQLGAFSTEAKANAAWKSLSGRFGFLAPLGSSVTPVTTANGTLYRLRASAAGEASSICARLKVAGENCTVIN